MTIGAGQLLRLAGEWSGAVNEYSGAVNSCSTVNTITGILLAPPSSPPPFPLSPPLVPPSPPLSPPLSPPSSPLVYFYTYDAVHPLTITAIALGSLFCACGLCLGVLLLSRRLSQAERAISEYKAISLMPARVPSVAEADSLCAELAESVPPTMPIPVELSVVAIAKATERERP